MLYLCSGVCQTDWSSYEDSCYRDFSLNSKQVEAKEHCHSFNAYLVQISDKAEAMFLQ